MVVRSRSDPSFGITTGMDKSVGRLIAPWPVPIGDEPFEDLVTKERQLAAAGHAVGGQDPLSHPTADDLHVGMEKFGEWSGIHDRWHFRVPTVVVDVLTHAVQSCSESSGASSSSGVGSPVRYRVIEEITSSRKKRNC